MALKKNTSTNNKSFQRFKTHNELEIGTICTRIHSDSFLTANVRK